MIEKRAIIIVPNQLREINQEIVPATWALLQHILSLSPFLHFIQRLAVWMQMFISSVIPCVLNSFHFWPDSCDC